MFGRRQKPPTTPDVPEPRGSAPDAGDATRVLAELLARPTQEGILEAALAYAARLLGGGVSAYAIVRRGQDRVGAVHGYSKALLGVALSGPWSSMRTRLLSDGARELYDQNLPDTQALLTECGMQAVTLSLVVPVSDRGRYVGAMVFDRTGPEGVTPSAQEAVTRWAAAIAPLLGILDSREDWKHAARQITGAVVEAVESREFDALGHAQSVADISLKLGAQIGLADRELEELWYAATMHDIGKIHGEAGHALVGANFLHGVGHLSEAQRAVRHHHERWDGQGEPDKLAGEDIPLYARIVAVANAYVRMGGLERVRAQAGRGLDQRIVAQLEKLDL
ncbi:HD-GYP domain-containing protein (c-di-GMP phosphodiesterase class II) [Deinococcus metalli]|uniref:HD-GYP domain-containing protein (C-di-GMP phosphodiesterase class II) n=1 Tax=Deinococcus metalli TaxID=1141878 RepID=A0A7W8KBU5_9DEIO|nr:HD domain-containing phosphohydrolase [Deinococcus metalli]MBB5375312.1 HD-GYP domain-containing protein (c-di-GMP phosphodiesterase class II) [Deinococcus metalli]GHF30181.1 phosphohydrolase [Deinococcus metalli]